MLLTLIGLVVLIVGGRLLVLGAIDLAGRAGLSEALIGLTIVAVGTSLPELITSVVAARRGAHGVAFGNVIGSNVYKILGIGGVTMVMAPGPIPVELLPLDIGLLVASAGMIVLFALARSVSRWPAVLMLAAYAGYLCILAADA